MPMEYLDRPYQTECIDKVYEKLTTDSIATLAVLSTGAGKTVIASKLSQKWPTGRVIFMAHRDELIQQAANKLHEITGDWPEIEMGSLSAADANRFQVTRSKY